MISYYRQSCMNGEKIREKPTVNTHYIVDSTPFGRPWHESALVRHITEGAARHMRVRMPNALHISCSVNQTLEFLNFALTRNVVIEFADYGVVFEPSMSLSALMLLIHKMGSNYTSARTMVALGKRRAKGLSLGRPKGKGNKTLRLDIYRERMEKWLTEGVSMSAIARHCKCHPQTVYDYVERKMGGKNKYLKRNGGES
jgi:hypothetical protein